MSSKSTNAAPASQESASKQDSLWRVAISSARKLMTNLSPDSSVPKLSEAPSERGETNVSVHPDHPSGLKAFWELRNTIQIAQRDLPLEEKMGLIILSKQDWSIQSYTTKKGKVFTRVCHKHWDHYTDMGYDNTLFLLRSDLRKKIRRRTLETQSRPPSTRSKAGRISQRSCNLLNSLRTTQAGKASHLRRVHLSRMDRCSSDVRPG